MRPSGSKLFPATGLLPVGLAAVASVAASAVWYAAFGKTLARWDQSYAESDRAPAWVMPVELARSATMAAAVAMLADRLHTEGPLDTARLGAGLWGAFL
jgi:hypothetical protein